MMAKCEGCKKYEDCRTGSGLTWPCGAYRPTVTTNADRIRAMSDEELAEILVAESLAEKIPFCQNKAECNEILDTADGTIPEGMCLKCALDWLRQPTKESANV